MGICTSCLGRGDDEPSVEDEQSRLLYDDPHSVHYGSFGDQTSSTLQADPQDLQRENEALQKIVAQTSNQLVDIFALVPQSLQRPPGNANSGKDARLLHYQAVLANLSSDSAPHNLEISSGSVADWPSDDEEEAALKSFQVIGVKETGPFLGGFTEVENGTR